jgi:16S rRNA A1518/A1519 N6-dimethyltransferase RsmA/KsgA/DIM1 with predicted DNA glycosylase/AP lyase activity
VKETQKKKRCKEAQQANPASNIENVQRLVLILYVNRRKTISKSDKNTQHTTHIHIFSLALKPFPITKSRAELELVFFLLPPAF